MKRHLSVISLASRSVIYKLLCISVLTSAVQVLLFYKVSASYTHSFPDIVSRARFGLVLGAGFLLLCAAACMSGCDLRGSRTGYTLRRLRVSESGFLVWQSAVNAVCFLIFWFCQAVTAAVLCSVFLAGPGEHVATAQTALIYFYGSEYLHSLIPIEDFFKLARNIVLCLSLGFCSAAFSFRQRRGKRAMGIFILAAVTAASFVSPMASGASDFALTVFAALTFGVVLFGIYSILSEEACDESDDQTHTQQL